MLNFFELNNILESTEAKNRRLNEVEEGGPKRLLDMLARMRSQNKPIVPTAGVPNPAATPPQTPAPTRVPPSVGGPQTPAPTRVPPSVAPSARSQKHAGRASFGAAGEKTDQPAMVRMTGEDPNASIIGRGQHRKLGDNAHRLGRAADNVAEFNRFMKNWPTLRWGVVQAMKKILQGKYPNLNEIIKQLDTPQIVDGREVYPMFQLVPTQGDENFPRSEGGGPEVLLPLRDLMRVMRLGQEEANAREESGSDPIERQAGFRDLLSLHGLEGIDADKAATLSQSNKDRMLNAKKRAQKRVVSGRAVQFEKFLQSPSLTDKEMTVMDLSKALGQMAPEGSDPLTDYEATILLLNTAIDHDYDFFEFGDDVHDQEGNRVSLKPDTLIRVKSPHEYGVHKHTYGGTKYPGEHVPTAAGGDRLSDEERLRDFLRARKQGRVHDNPLTAAMQHQAEKDREIQGNQAYSQGLDTKRAAAEADKKARMEAMLKKRREAAQKGAATRAANRAKTQGTPPAAPQTEAQHWLDVMELVEHWNP